MRSELDVAIALGAGVALILGLVARFIKNRLWIFEPTRRCGSPVRRVIP